MLLFYRQMIFFKMIPSHFSASETDPAQPVPSRYVFLWEENVLEKKMSTSCPEWWGHELRAKKEELGDLLLSKELNEEQLRNSKMHPNSEDESRSDTLLRSCSMGKLYSPFFSIASPFFPCFPTCPSRLLSLPIFLFSLYSHSLACFLHFLRHELEAKKSCGISFPPILDLCDTQQVLETSSFLSIAMTLTQDSWKNKLPRWEIFVCCNSYCLNPFILLCWTIREQVIDIQQKIFLPILTAGECYIKHHQIRCPEGLISPSLNEVL